MEKENSKRIQTSFLNGLEKRALVWMANRLPAWVTSDMLTFVGSFGSLVFAVGFILSSLNVYWLWLASFGLAVNWFGDSLDGTLARVRKTQRPLYGFFVDHMIDCFNETVMFIGVGLSPFIDLKFALLVLVFYLLLSVYVYINAHLKSEFKLTYAKMGPTEFRLLVIIANTLLMYITPLREYSREIIFLGMTGTLSVLDMFALFVVLVLALMLIINFVRDAKGYARLDPLKKYEKK